MFDMNYCPKCGSTLTSKIIDGDNRHACSSEQCSYVFWNNPVPVVAALVEHEGSYIIARNALWPEGIFSVITGYLEAEESPEDAVIREVEEELGLTATIRKHIGNYMFREKNQVILCYEIEAAGEIETNHELAEIRHLSADELSAYDFSPLYITKNIIRGWKGSDNI